MSDVVRHLANIGTSQSGGGILDRVIAATVQQAYDARNAAAFADAMAATEARQRAEGNTRAANAAADRVQAALRDVRGDSAARHSVQRMARQIARAFPAMRFVQALELAASLYAMSRLGRVLPSRQPGGGFALREAGGHRLNVVQNGPDQIWSATPAYPATGYPGYPSQFLFGVPAPESVDYVADRSFYTVQPQIDPTWGQISSIYEAWDRPVAGGPMNLPGSSGKYDGLPFAPPEVVRQGTPTPDPGAPGTGSGTAPFGDPSPQRFRHRDQARFDRYMQEASEFSERTTGTPAPKPASDPSMWDNEVALTGDLVLSAPKGKPLSMSVRGNTHEYRTRNKSKERKLRMNTRTAVWLLWGLATETADFISAIWKAIPSKDRKSRGRRVDYMLQDIYNNWDKIDLTEAIYNVLENQVEDGIIGAINGSINRRTGNLTNTGAQGMATRVNYAHGNNPITNDEDALNAMFLLSQGLARAKLAFGVEQDPRDRRNLEKIARGYVDTAGRPIPGPAPWER